MKSVGSTTLLPTISIPDFLNDEIPYRYLERLFSDYTTEQFSESCYGECFSADWYSNPNKPDYILVQYRVFEEHEDVFTVQYTEEGNPRTVRVDGLPHRKAYDYCEIGRKQGLESLLSTLDKLEKDRSFRHTEFLTYTIFLNS